jgi:lysophospholipase L1-like esterase
MPDQTTPEAEILFRSGATVTTAAQLWGRTRLDVPSNADLAAASLGSLDPSLYQGQITSLGQSLPAAGMAGRWYYCTVAGTLTDPDAASAVVQIGGYLISNGSAYVTRNATPVMDAAILTAIRNDVNSRFTVARNLFNPDKATLNKVINASGNVPATDTSNYKVSDFMPVTPGTNIISNTALHGSGTAGAAFYDWNRVFIAGSFISTPISANTPVAVPANACFCRVTIAPGGTIQSIAIFNSDAVPASWVSSVFDDALTTQGRANDWVRDHLPVENIFDRMGGIAGSELQTGGTEAVNASFRITNYMPVTPGNIIKLSHLTGGGPNYGIVYYDRNKVRLTVSQAGPLAANTAYTVPQMAFYARFCLLNTETARNMVVVQSSTGTLPTGYRGFGGGFNASKRRQGLGLGLEGDSITQNSGWKNYASRFINAPIVYDNSSSGAGTAHKINVTSGALANVDLLVIALGTNDWGFNRPLGALGDAASPHQPTPGNYAGTGTFHGDVRAIIEARLTEKPTIRLAYTTPLPRTAAATGGSGAGVAAINSLGFTLRQYCEAIIAVCKQYSVPVLDLNIVSGLNTYNLAGYTTAGDGLHPNLTGDAFYAPQIGPWLDTL